LRCKRDQPMKNCWQTVPADGDEDNAKGAVVAGAALVFGSWGAFGFWPGVIVFGLWLVWIITVDEIAQGLRADL
jgi:hypothetical protein